MSVDAVIGKMGLRGVRSVNQAIVTVSEFLDGKDISTINSLIKEMGGVPVNSHPVDADIMLKYMIQRVVEGTFVDVGEIQAGGRVKIEQLRRKLPFVFVSTEEVVDPSKPEPKKPKGDRNNKNAASLEFVAKMAAEGATDRGTVTKALAEELDIEYAGAFFYVKKAEKALGLTFTSRRQAA